MHTLQHPEPRRASPSINPDIPTEGQVPAGQVTGACWVGQQTQCAHAPPAHRPCGRSRQQHVAARQARPAAAPSTSYYSCVVVGLPPDLIIKLALPGASLQQHGQGASAQVQPCLLQSQHHGLQQASGDRQAGETSRQAGWQGQGRHLHGGRLLVGRHHNSIEQGHVDCEHAVCCSITHVRVPAIPAPAGRGERRAWQTAGGGSCQSRAPA